MNKKVHTVMWLSCELLLQHALSTFLGFASYLSRDGGKLRSLPPCHFPQGGEDKEVEGHSGGHRVSCKKAKGEWEEAKVCLVPILSFILTVRWTWKCENKLGLSSPLHCGKCGWFPTNKKVCVNIHVNDIGRWVNLPRFHEYSSKRYVSSKFLLQNWLQ